MADTKQTLLMINSSFDQIALSKMCKEKQAAQLLQKEEKAKIRLQNKLEEIRLRISNTPNILLGIENDDETTFHHLRVGARTCAVLATQPGVKHRFQKLHERIVVKLYKGQGNTDGSREYQNFHEKNFHSIRALSENEHVQQSVTGGLLQGVGPFAVVQYVEGEELRPRLTREDLTRQQATGIVRDILKRIWIPLWDSGLRFKDCHPGNLVLTPAMKTVLIDTEMMRKDAVELLLTPDIWAQRDKHESTGLGRLAGLIKEVVKAVNSDLGVASIAGKVTASLNAVELSDQLALLGRPRGSVESAKMASNLFIQDLISKGLLE